jgi:hypothetical protein
MTPDGCPSIVVMGMLALVGCAPAGVDPPPRLGCAPPPMQDDDNIRETVLRTLIDGFLSSRAESRYSRTIQVIFVGVDGGPDPTSEFFGWDPPDSFLSRFADIEFPVRPVSAASLWDDARERATGNPGVVFSAGSICWVSPNEVDVEAARWFGMTGGASYTFHLTSESGRWVITSGVTHWVS